MDERDWIRRIVAGDTQSFSCLVAKYEKMAYTIALRIVENREDAEEVVQDAFLKMYRALLKKAEGNKALALKIQGILKEEGLLDEKAFAEEYAEEHSFRGIGPRRILEGLAEEGVSRETRASLSLNEDEGKARDHLPVMERKFGGLPKRERVEKGTAFLVRKGFSEGLSREVASDIRENKRERKEYLKSSFLKIRTGLEGRYNDQELRYRVRAALLGKGFSLVEIEEEERLYEQDR